MSQQEDAPGFPGLWYSRLAAFLEFGAILAIPCCLRWVMCYPQLEGHYQQGPLIEGGRAPFPSACLQHMCW